MDYEIAIRNAAKHVWPYVQTGGCLFHLGSNFKKHLQIWGLMQSYRTDPEFAQTARMLLAVAYVPLDRIEEALAFLKNRLAQEFQPIVAWLEDNYVG